jgi:hypothetical protein
MVINKSITTSTELDRLSRDLRIHLNGIYSKDQLINVKPRKGGYIINMQNSNDGNGSHWIAVYLSEHNNLQRKRTSAYFDSFGIICPYEVMDFMGRWSNDAIFCNKQIQDVDFGGCGQYVLEFLRHMQNSHGTPRQRYIKFLSKYEFLN